MVIPVSSVHAFEYYLYDGFFISYDRCDTSIDAENEMLRIYFSKIVAESLESSICSQLENTRFEYDYKTSNEIWTKKIKFDEESSYRIFTTVGDGRVPVVLPKNWNVGDSLIQDFGPEISSLEYVGQMSKEINDNSIKVHEFEAEEFMDEGGNVASFKVTSQYDVDSGFLVAQYYHLGAANALIGGGSATITFEAKDISEKPFIPKITESISKAKDGGGCLIATATFDSELSPQVQKLREIRDSKLLQTESGSQFLESFNSFYYSFSPIIADYERENPVFKELVKIAITPMLSTLSLMDYADTESEVLGIGISLIILNGIMYVGLPVFGIMFLRKQAIQ